MLKVLHMFDLAVTHNPLPKETKSFMEVVYIHYKGNFFPSLLHRPYHQMCLFKAVSTWLHHVHQLAKANTPTEVNKRSLAEIKGKEKQKSEDTNQVV